MPPDILVALDRLELSHAFRADGHLPCPGSVSLWGRDTPGHNDFILNPMGPAWHISRARFEAMLRTRAAQMGASICTRTRAVAVRRTDDHFDVLLQDPAGGRRAMRAWRYGERVAARFEDYLANRAHLYALERRWTDRPFWRRRAQA